MDAIVTDAAPAMPYRLDGSVRRYGTVLIGGSPLKLLRLTAAGNAIVDRLGRGEEVAPSPLLDRLVDSGIAHPVPRKGPLGSGDVTVVVPTLGAPRYLPDGALVVDDGSSPPVAGATIRSPTNRGPAAARNAGLDHVTTPLVAFVDGDVEVDDGWLEPLVAHFADPRVAAVAPRIAARPAPGAIAAYEQERSPLDMGAQPAPVRAGTRVSYVPAAAVVCRVDAVRSLGGFDTTLRFGEDVDLIWRLDDAGWRVRYEPASVVHHDARRTLQEWIAQRIDYGSSAGPLATRHRGKLAPLRMSGWSVAVWALVAAGRPVAGVAVGAGSAAALVSKLPDVPPKDAFSLAATGNLRAGSVIASAIRRTWWPVLAVAALRSRTARRAVVLTALTVDPRQLVDDVAYSIGVWKGMFAARTLEPLVPKITSWPGRVTRRRTRRSLASPSRYGRMS